MNHVEFVFEKDRFVILAELKKILLNYVNIPCFAFIIN